MTVRVERTIDVHATPEEVWQFIADPEKRAQAISVVRDWETTNDETTWYIELPIPFVSQTMAVKTRETSRVEGKSVKFTGTSPVMRVIGEHELAQSSEGRTKLTNRFIIDGRIPGVERYFKKNLPAELENLQNALSETVQPDS